MNNCKTINSNSSYKGKKKDWNLMISRSKNHKSWNNTISEARYAADIKGTTEKWGVNVLDS